MIKCGIHRLHGIILLILTCSAFAFSQSQSFPNEFGWVWGLQPTATPRGMSSESGFLITVNELKNGNLLMSAAYAEQLSKSLYSLRAVGFDSLKRRYEFDSQGSVSSDGITLKSFRLPPSRLPAIEVKYIGIEELSELNLRTLLAPAAFKKLKEAGEQALMYPEIGKPFVFDLVSIDGRSISSRDFSGKVVLLDCWASWCAPCMAKMPKLKDVYRKLKGRGFEVVGLNHDNSMENARKYTVKEQLPWPVVLAPSSAQHREWWATATSISVLPRLLLIDRKGVLRADVSTNELAQEIDKLLAE